MSIGRSQTERNRAVLPAIIYVSAAVLLLLPVGSAFGEWQHMLRYGWPGPFGSAIARANADESLFKVGFWLIPSAVVLVSATIGAGFAARSAGQRVWVVTIVGLVGTLAVVLTTAALLTAPVAVPAG